MTPTEFVTKLQVSPSPADAYWYAIADAAQNRALPAAIAPDGRSRCLLGATDGSPLAAQSPHLVALPAPHEQASPWRWIERQAKHAPCATVLASALAFDELFAHLQLFTEVLLPDGTDMLFAFWDPATLGTLVGQADDATLHVPGPVLDPAQQRALLRNLSGWWYWDREGSLHHIDPGADVDGVSISEALKLTQEQVDTLVEASVPDHLIAHTRQNQPELLDRLAAREQYRFVRQQLARARAHGLVGTGDLVNYVCVALAFGARFDEIPAMAALMQRVRTESLPFKEVLSTVNEPELEAAAQAPALL